MVFHEEGLKFYHEFFTTLQIYAANDQVNPRITHFLAFDIAIDRNIETVGRFLEHISDTKNHLDQDNNTLHGLKDFLERMYAHPDTGTKRIIQDSLHDVQGNSSFDQWLTRFDDIKKGINDIKPLAEQLQSIFERLRKMQLNDRLSEFEKGPNEYPRKDIKDNAYQITNKLDFLEKHFMSIARSMLALEDFFTEDLEYLKKKETLEGGFRNNLKSWIDRARKETTITS